MTDPFTGPPSTSQDSTQGYRSATQKGGPAYFIKRYVVGAFAKRLEGFRVNLVGSRSAEADAR
jgi:hypothetical protein